MKYSKIIIKTAFIGLLCFLTSCADEEPTIVPDVYVNFSINLSLPQYNSLNAINNAVIETNEGYAKNGVIVYRFTLEDFFAFDATCPQHILTSTAINLDDNGAAGTATCPHCDAQYSLYNSGYPDNGYPLKRYRVRLSGSILSVFN